MNKPFDIDFKRWLLLLLPTPLRKKVLVRLMYVMMRPIGRLHGIFLSNRDTDNFFAKYDSSYGNLKRMLNSLFPSQDGEIDVREADTTELEYQRVYVTQDRMEYGSAFVGQSYIDKAKAQKLFDVILPDDVKSDTEKVKEINSIVSRYALPGYGFNIY